ETHHVTARLKHSIRSKGRLLIGTASRILTRTIVQLMAQCWKKSKLRQNVGAFIGLLRKKPVGAVNLTKESNVQGHMLCDRLAKIIRVMYCVLISILLAGCEQNAATRMHPLTDAEYRAIFEVWEQSLTEELELGMSLVAGDVRLANVLGSH